MVPCNRAIQAAYEKIPQMCKMQVGVDAAPCQQESAGTMCEPGLPVEVLERKSGMEGGRMMARRFRRYIIGCDGDEHNVMLVTHWSERVYGKPLTLSEATHE